MSYATPAEKNIEKGKKKKIQFNPFIPGINTMLETTTLQAGRVGFLFRFYRIQAVSK